MASVSEMKKATEERSKLLDELRAATETMSRRAPGQPAVEIPLDKVLTFSGDEGPKAVIEIQQIIYIVDGILRDAASQ